MTKVLEEPSLEPEHPASREEAVRTIRVARDSQEWSFMRRASRGAENPVSPGEGPGEPEQEWFIE
jgi:hypothetical protein